MNIASQKQTPFVQFLQLAILYAYAFTYLERTLFQAQKNQFGPVITILGPIHLSARKESPGGHPVGTCQSALISTIQHTCSNHTLIPIPQTHTCRLLSGSPTPFSSHLHPEIPCIDMLPTVASWRTACKSARTCDRFIRWQPALWQETGYFKTFKKVVFH